MKTSNHHDMALTSVMCAVLGVLLLVDPVSALGVEIPGRPQVAPFALRGAIIHVGDGSTIPTGTVVVDQGRIAAIGPDVAIPANAEVIDLTGKHLYPSLIEPNSGIGLVEIDAVRASVDVREIGNANPNVRAVVAFTPDSEVIPVTRANGILIAHSVPHGSFLSGRSSLMLLDGWNANDMTLKEVVGMHVSWPRISAAAAPADAAPYSAELASLRQLLDDARAYQSARNASDKTPVNLRLEAMLAVVHREVPLFVHADEATQIQAAVAFAAAHELRIVVVGGYDAPYCAELLKAHDIPVILSAVQRLPIRRDESPDAAFTLARRLRDAGVKYCIGGSGRFEASNIRNLPYHAGMAAAHGLTPDEALRAITLSTAEILGVADRVGSLSVGKDATLFVANGDILEIATQVEKAWIQGRSVDLNSRHTRLWKKYEQRYDGAASQTQNAAD